MVRSFRDRNTRRFFEGRRVAAYQGFASQARRRLVLLDSAETLGDRAGQHSIRINAQWRVCFCWTDEGPCDVEIVDYRRGGPT